MSRKVCFVTGTRAEFGLLRWVMEEVRSAPGMELQLVVTGTHLSPEFGLTYNEIEEAGYVADARVEMLVSADTATGICKSMALGLIGLADAYARLRPDMIVVLGDRYEILAAATAALVAGIPLSHLHGGECTEGAYDDAFRHSITKMSHLHFVATEEYRRRVIQLGEQPDHVFTVGGLGIDAIQHVSLLERGALEEALDFKLGRRNLLVTFHPPTLEEPGIAARQFAELLVALDRLESTHLIFTMPNADTGSRALWEMLGDFVRTHPNARAYESLGQLRYLSCLKWVDGVVGNSSSGIAEAPSMAIGTINIGDRQRGRMFATSVIQSEPDAAKIRQAIERLYSDEFQRSLPGTVNPYGNGGAAAKIAQILRDHPLAGITKKRFHDVETNNQ